MTALLLTSEVAAYAGVRPETVLAWVKQGKLRAIRTPGGRGIRYTEEACRSAGIEVASDDDGHADRGDEPATSSGPGAAEEPPGDYRAGCPSDTNGDGDCGRRACPYCGEKRAHA